MKKEIFECVRLGAIALIVILTFIFLAGVLVEFCCFAFDLTALLLFVTLNGWYIALKLNQTLAKFFKSETKKFLRKYIRIVKERNSNMKNFIMFVLVTMTATLVAIIAVWKICSFVTSSDHPLGYILLACSVALMVFGSIHDNYKRKNYYY